MKTRKVRDILVGFLLTLSLGLGGILVSCSEDNGVFNDPGSSGIDPFGGSGAETSTISTLFLSLGKGAASEIGGELAGWTLGAMGLTAASGPNYQQQINKILSQLQAIVSILNQINTELITINNTLTTLDCHTQQSTLLSEISAIKSSYQHYQSITFTASQGDTIPNSELKEWADIVLLGNASYMALQPALNSIVTSLESTGGPIISCIQQTTPLEEGGFGADATYYNRVSFFTNYYYYYQTLALMMISEAEHYYAWYNAGQPGGSFISADSVQQVCTSNPTSQIHCNNVAIETNDLYNAVIKQMTDGGAPYTNDYVLYQHFQEKPRVWVRSLEDFTTAAGYNCNSPLTNSNPCGPTSGTWQSTLQVNTYREMGPFHFAQNEDLTKLLDPSKIGTATNGHYLSTQGFENMTQKTIVAPQLINVTFSHDNVSREAIVFFNTDVAPVNGIYSVINTQDGFRSVFSSHQESNKSGQCGAGNNYISKLYHYRTSGNFPTADSWTSGFAKIRTCGDGHYVTPFEWTDHNYTGSDCCIPGFMKERPGGSPARFLMPVMIPTDNNCTNNWTPFNKGNVYTMCRDDFKNFLNSNVPRPPTCDIPNIPSSCTVLE